MRAPIQESEIIMRKFGLILLCLMALGAFANQAEARHPYRCYGGYGYGGYGVHGSYYGPRPYASAYRYGPYGSAYYGVPAYYYGGPSPFIHRPVYGGYAPYGW